MDLPTLYHMMDDTTEKNQDFNDDKEYIRIISLENNRQIYQIHLSVRLLDDMLVMLLLLEDLYSLRPMQLLMLVVHNHI